ncbi:MAG: hypothetical protein ACI93P_000718 [bacterium]|jgi:hypothetical protein
MVKKQAIEKSLNGLNINYAGKGSWKVRKGCN